MKANVKIKSIETACLTIIPDEEELFTLEVDCEPVAEDVTLDDLKDLKEGIEYLIKSLS